MNQQRPWQSVGPSSPLDQHNAMASAQSLALNRSLQSTLGSPLNLNRLPGTLPNTFGVGPGITKSRSGSDGSGGGNNSYNNNKNMSTNVIDRFAFPTGNDISPFGGYSLGTSSELLQDNLLFNDLGGVTSSGKFSASSIGSGVSSTNSSWSLPPNEITF